MCSIFINNCLLKCFGSVSFWYGSSDQFCEITDPDPTNIGKKPTFKKKSIKNIFIQKLICCYSRGKYLCDFGWILWKFSIILAYFLLYTRIRCRIQVTEMKRIRIRNTGVLCVWSISKVPRLPWRPYSSDTQLNRQHTYVGRHATRVLRNSWTVPLTDHKSWFKKGIFVTILL